MRHTVLFFVLASFCLAQQKPTPVVVKAGRLVDVSSGKILEKQVILIHGDKIASVGPEGSIPPPSEATVIDLSNAIVMPGFIDCHTHIVLQFERYDDRFRKSPIDAAVMAHMFARRTLEAGFTTCRDVGSGEFIDVALKKAINAGRIVGPRLYVAGHGLSTTGGHGDLSGFSPYLRFDNFNGVVDGLDEIRKKIRWNIKYGADLIKFTATAGVLSEEESFGAPQFSFDEMKAIVEEATTWGKRVAAHAHGAEGIKMAVRAGVASIEHGSLLDDEGIVLMKQKGTFLVPTVIAGDAVVRYGKQYGLPEILMEKARAVNAKKRESYRKAIKAGVKIAFGTDAGVFPHGMNGEEFRLLVELGMTPMQAIQSATKTAAELLGHSDVLGAIEAGKYADLVAVKSDPLKDVSVLEKVQFVMKGGVVYKDETKK